MIPVQHASGQPQSGSLPPHPPIIQVVFLLLLTICFASLGSFSLVPYLLPDLSSSSVLSSTPAATSHTPGLSTSTPTTGPFIESECTAKPSDMKYVSASQGQTGTSSLPNSWSQTGRTQQDFANAQACAASFVVAYQTFDSNDIKTLEACTFMLTKNASQRFYGTTQQSQPDKHEDPMWRASLQKRHYQQTAQAALPGLLTTRSVNNRFLVWMTVPYQTSTKIDDSQQSVIQTDQFTVLLVAVPINAQKTGTGWQVSKWQEGSAQFDPPNPL